MEKRRQISRRDFLKLVGMNVAALAIPVRWTNPAPDQPVRWPTLNLATLPSEVRNIISKVLRLEIDREGYLFHPNDTGETQERVPVARTAWNIERSGPFDKLDQGVQWGIVLHWYGDEEGFDRSSTGYLRGFDSLRRVDDYLTRTSAHFLVGRSVPKTDQSEDIAIIQTQIPASEGVPFLASHLQQLDRQAHLEGKQYFVRALYQLSYSEPAIHLMLQDFYDGPGVDPNFRTIAIELTGHDFENPAHYPPDQQIANLVSLIWAVMKRYGIEAMNVMGHNEIQLGKADPGKKFMALIRYLIGVKALLEDDAQMNQLVFGRFLQGGEPGEAVRKYFEFVRDYLVIVGSPRTVYEWEAWSKYWFLYDFLPGSAPSKVLADEFRTPVYGSVSLKGGRYLSPENYEGVDLYWDVPVAVAQPVVSTAIRLAAPGECVFVDTSAGNHTRKMVAFRHRQSSGAEVVSMYGHLDTLEDVTVGDNYPEGTPIGTIQNTKIREGFLHFAVAYGATWDIALSGRPEIPENVNAGWIAERFIDPLELIDVRSYPDSYHMFM